MNALKPTRANLLKESLTPIAAMLVAWFLVLVAVAGAVVVLLQQEPVKAQASPTSPSYTVTDLGAFGASYTPKAFDINDAGQVVGQANLHAFLYEDGQTRDLGTLGSTHQISKAYGINDAGQVVGWSAPLVFCTGGDELFLFIESEPCEAVPRRAFLYKENQGMTDL